MTPKYWETVVIGWRILWQGIGGFLLALFLLNLIILGLQPELTRTDPSFWVLAFLLILASILSLFIVLPLVVRGLLKRSFGTFRLVVKRVEPMNS